MAKTESDMTADPFFRSLECPVWVRPLVFLGRIARLNPGMVTIVAIVVGTLGLVEGIGLSILLPLLSLIGVETGANAGGPARAVEFAFVTLGIPLTLGPVLAVFFVVGVILIALHSVQQYLLVRSSEHVTSFLRCRLFEAANRASWSMLIAGRGAHLINAITGEATRIGVVYGNALAAFGMVVSFLVYVALAVWLSWRLTLVAAAIGCISMLALRGIYRSSRRFGKYTSTATNKMQEVLNEHINGAKLIRALGAGAWSQATFVAAVEAVARYGRRNQGNTILIKTSVEPFGLLLIVLMVYLSIDVIRLPAAELMLMLLIVLRITPRLVALQELLQRISGMLPAYETVADTLQRLKKAQEPQGSTAFTGLQKAIVLKGVTVRHEDIPVLKDVDLSIPVRTTVGLVGRSGGGKTTLLDVILGVVTPEKGEVLLDDVSLCEFDMTTYRQRIGIVPQDGTFFHGTIAENLRIVAPQATETEIWQALELAHAREFVQARDRQLEEVIGDQGLRLSGGQRQRLALARALLRKPDILLLDEPTSAMDGETEMAIRETLRRLHGQVTVVLVTHRHEMVEDADIVYTISEGLAKPLEIVSGNVGGGNAV